MSDIDLRNHFRGSLASVGLTWQSDEQAIEAAAQAEWFELECAYDEDELDGLGEDDVREYLTDWVARERSFHTAVEDEESE